MRTGTVLVVDDEMNVRKSVRRTLSSRFTTVLLAENADAAEKLMEQHSIDVAIVDQKMPGRSGLQLVSTIREKYPSVRCILLTGWAPYHKMVAALKEKQICGFIRKPWDDAELVSRVEKLVDAATAQEALESRNEA